LDQLSEIASLQNQPVSDALAEVAGRAGQTFGPPAPSGGNSSSGGSRDHERYTQKLVTA
jgi:hypothetical protein